MLDAAIKTQLQAYLGHIKQPIECRIGRAGLMPCRRKGP